jgi:hypothetical protein
MSSEFDVLIKGVLAACVRSSSGKFSFHCHIILLNHFFRTTRFSFYATFKKRADKHQYL